MKLSDQLTSILTTRLRDAERLQCHSRFALRQALAGDLHALEVVLGWLAAADDQQALSTPIGYDRHDYRSGAYVGPASAADLRRSLRAAKYDGAARLAFRCTSRESRSA